MTADITDLGHTSVDISIRTTDGSVVRVAAVNDTVRLTVSGAEGMVTAVLTDLDADSVDSAISKASLGAGRFKRGAL